LRNPSNSTMNLVGPGQTQLKGKFVGVLGGHFTCRTGLKLAIYRQHHQHLANIQTGMPLSQTEGSI